MTNTTTVNKAEKHFRRPEVEELTGLSRTTIYAMMSKGEFPRPVRLTRKAVAWPESRIREWMDARSKGEFPSKTTVVRPVLDDDSNDSSQSLRDKFAAHALSALLAAGRDPNCSPKGYAADAYLFADAMLEARK